MGRVFFKNKLNESYNQYIPTDTSIFVDANCLYENESENNYNLISKVEYPQHWEDARNWWKNEFASDPKKAIEKAQACIDKFENSEFNQLWNDKTRKEYSRMKAMAVVAQEYIKNHKKHVKESCKVNEAATPKGVEQAKKVKDDLISFAKKLREYKDVLLKRRTQIENLEIHPSDKHIISHMYKELANMLIPVANEATDYAKKVDDIEKVGQIRIGHFL